MGKIGARGKPYHFTACAFVAHEGKILLVKHRKLNKWLAPGGHLETDGKGMYLETPEEGAAREVLEETGLRVEILGTVPGEQLPRRLSLRLPFDLHIHHIDEQHDHFGFDYLARPVAGQPLDGKGDESYRWWTRDELERHRGKDFEGALLLTDVADGSLRALDANGR
jgi:ADP-ribose pyrophosphatase YjhB (NUDIX family)